LGGDAVGRDFRGYIFDLDGTVYRGEQLLPGAQEAISTLRARGKKISFISNKPIESRVTYAHKLTRLGIPTAIEEVVNSSLVMAEYLRGSAPGTTVYCIGEPPLIQDLTEAGLVVTDDPRRAAYLVVAFDRTFHYGKLNDAMIALRNGARFVATNPDRTCPIEGGEIPDCAGMIGAITGVTGLAPEVIVGKPNPLILRTVLSRLCLAASDCLMIGDRLETDIRMGRETGMATALVLSGATSRDQLSRSPLQPDLILESLAELLPALEDKL
jgi:arabinose operon protein AraL